MTAEQALEALEESSAELASDPAEALPSVREDLTARAEFWARGARADKTWAAYQGCR